jgi:heat-inducible transcriptional repressor
MLPRAAQIVKALDATWGTWYHHFGYVSTLVSRVLTYVGSSMPMLTERQETVLALIIHEYIDTAQPVGSVSLVDKYNLGISSATARNEMVALTEAGLLRQPHTSAGRVPSEEGYRYFVRRLLGETELPADEKRLISHQFHQARADVDEWVRLAASVLAQHSRVASLVTAPHAERAVFKHLELISTQARQALLVLVMQGGEVRQQMLTLAESFDQERLTQTADQITRACTGKDAVAVAAQAARFTGLEQEVTRLVADTIARTDAVSAGEIHRDGLSNVLAQPEFADSANARSALRLLEEHSFLEEVLAKALSPSVGGVQVVIGGEGAWEELKDCSMILARYGAPGFATGALGVLGPTRMAYGHSISAVRYVAGLMSDLVIESFAG